MRQPFLYIFLTVLRGLGYAFTMEVIRSKDNPKVKRFALLHDRKKAAKEGLVFIEGTRICEDALLSGVEPVSFVYSEEKEKLANEWTERYGISCEIVCVTSECFTKIASTVNPQGVALITKIPEMSKELPLRQDKKDIFVVLENLQDPGNLGTIIRLADAFDFNAVIMTRDCADPYNEKVLRSSMGSVWHIPLITMEDTGKILDELDRRGIDSIACELHGDDMKSADLRLPAAYLIGNEGKGLKAETIERCSRKIKIPMPGKAESLNAASAASIIGYVLASLK